MKNEKKQKVKKERKKSTFWADFKAFISRGNIVDLAVAVVVGAAFTAIVNSVVNDIIKPCIALLVNGNLSELAIVLRPAVFGEDGVTVVTEAITLNYGNLIMAVFTFLIDAFVIFTALRIARNARKKLQEGAELLKDKIIAIEENIDGNVDENADEENTENTSSENAEKNVAEITEENTEETAKESEKVEDAPDLSVAIESAETNLNDSETVALLKEIRDLLKSDKQK